MVTKKMFDSNKNVTKRGMIIKGVYYRSFEGNKERPDQCWLIFFFSITARHVFFWKFLGPHRLSISKKDSEKGYQKTWVITIGYA
jgi:hypothetical protein